MIAATPIGVAKGKKAQKSLICKWVKKNNNLFLTSKLRVCRLSTLYEYFYETKVLSTTESTHTEKSEKL